MNMQEQIEKAFRAGFECAMENSEVDEDSLQVWSLNEKELEEAVTHYVNTVE